MWSREKIEKRLVSEGIEGQIWGRRGPEVVRELEEQVNFSFHPDLALFAQFIGNLMVNPFNILVTGDENGEITCVTESEQLGILDNKSKIKGIKIMDHAGESYIWIKNSNVINVYESIYLDENNVLMKFCSLSDMIDWIIKEAKLIQL